MDSSSWPLAKQLNFTTGQQLIQLPTNLLEIFIPGYGTTSALLSETFGFDIKLIVSISLFIFALLKSVDYLRHQIISFLTRFGTCYIAIDSTGDAYHWVMSLLRQKGVGVQASGLLAVSSLHVGSWQPAQSDNLQFEVDGVPLAHTSSNTDGKKPTVRYEPDLGTWLYFWHDGRLSLWYRQKEQQKANVIDFLGDTKIEGRLYCFSRSTAPIKAFIQDALNEHQRKNAAFTSIRRPAPSKQRRSGNNPWIKVATRPSRPLDTIVLDDERKTQIIADIEEYLDPNTRRWYAGRGIPYRRGYLLYGPPGTGKTSLSFALAGAFGLDVFCISLAEASITEEDLVTLFEKLPEKCLVLLEDIDSAGLANRGNLTTTSQSSSSHARSAHQDGPCLRECSNPEMVGDANEQLQPRTVNETPKNLTSSHSRISLSGLLNVIDGVASHEGRVLIMATNNLDQLDDALLRPGRIDLRVRFELVTHSQAEKLFVQMFSPLDGDYQSSPFSAETKKATATATNNGHTLKSALERGNPKHSEDAYDQDGIVELARQLVREIPNGILSAAEIQGFLMMHKKRPADAVAQVGKWAASRRTGR